MSKFTPDIDFTFYNILSKFVPSDKKSIQCIEKTFCIDNKLLSVFLENHENCRFFNIKTDGKQEWWWAYAYNLMFQAIDFDWDTDIWLCKVIGYLE